MVIHPGDSQPIREVRRRSLKTSIQFFGFALLRLYHFAILHSCFLIVSSCSRFQRCVTLRLREFTFPPFHNHKVSELSIFMSSLSLEFYGVFTFMSSLSDFRVQSSVLPRSLNAFIRIHVYCMKSCLNLGSDAKFIINFDFVEKSLK